MAENIPMQTLLAGHKTMLLTTFRKTGVGVSTPVWFAVEGDVLYMLTDPKAGKVKRVRNNCRVQMAPCSFNGKVRGPTIDGEARILPPNERHKAIDALNRKYGLTKRFLDLFERHLDKRVYFEIRQVPGE